MGKIRSGILSRVSGKVAGVVGGNWKDVAYLREYVIPANPNTVAQQTQRTKFAACVEFAKPLVGPVFQTYTDKFQKRMSGYNAFIKANISVFPTPGYASIKMTEGPLFPPFDLDATADSSSITLEWDASALGPNGAATDKVFGVAYNPLLKSYYYPAAPVDRSVEALVFPGLESSTAYELYIWAASYSGAILRSISNSGHVSFSTL